MKYTYTFDQLRDNPAGRKVMFESYEWTTEHGGVDPDNYFTADSGTISADSPILACENLYYVYNAHMPLSYEGRAMCVSDIVNIWDNEQDPPVKSSWFCDRVGFVQIE